MSHTILLPTDGNPAAAAAIDLCMRHAQAEESRVVGLFVLPCDDLSMPEDDQYVPESERPCSVVYAANALRVIEHAAAAAGVPCTTLVRCADSPYAAVLKTASEQQCSQLFLGALECKPDLAEQEALRQLVGGEDPIASSVLNLRMSSPT